MKLDDQIYITEGIRKEQLDKAITYYGLDKKDDVGNVRGLG